MESASWTLQSQVSQAHRWFGNYRLHSQGWSSIHRINRVLFSYWWFQTLFIFHNIWDNPSHWIIFFKMVKTTNQLWSIYPLKEFPQDGWLLQSLSWYMYTLCITVYCIQVFDGMIFHHPFTMAILMWRERLSVRSRRWWGSFQSWSARGKPWKAKLDSERKSFDYEWWLNGDLATGIYGDLVGFIAIYGDLSWDL
jgi:hypothetical protein